MIWIMVLWPLSLVSVGVAAYGFGLRNEARWWAAQSEDRYIETNLDKGGISASDALLFVRDVFTVEE